MMICKNRDRSFSGLPANNSVMPLDRRSFMSIIDDGLNGHDFWSGIVFIMVPAT